MKLSKSWTKVTPLSKTLALILFIALPFIGFYLGVNYNDPIENTKENTPPENSPQRVTENFYQWYINCLNDDFANSNGNSPKQNCPYQASAYVNKDFISKSENIQAYDPVLCSQNVPTSYKVGDAQVSGNTANIPVRTYYVTGEQSLEVSLESDAQNWLISDIKCAK